MSVIGTVATLQDFAKRSEPDGKIQKIIELQGGNPAVVDDPALLPQAAEVELFTAPQGDDA